MADNTNKDEGTSSKNKDDDNNLKAEMNRKLSNIEQDNTARFDELKKFNENLLAQVQTLATAATTQKQTQQAKVESSTLEDLWYDKPDEAAAIIKEQAKKEALKEMRADQATRDQQNSVIAGLTAQYPELTDPNGKLQKRAIEIYNKMADKEKESPHASKVAVLDAAAELGITARTSSEGDSFTGLSGSSSGTRDSAKEVELDPNLIRFAEIMSQITGEDLTSEKSKKNLRTHVKRFSDPKTALKFS